MRRLLHSLIFIWPLMGCMEDTTPSSSPPRFVSPAPNPSLYARLKEEDTNREVILLRSQKTYHGSPLCSTEETCSQMCSGIFLHEEARGDCNKLSVAQIHRLRRIDEFLRNKDIKRLKSVRLFDLRVFLNISPEPVRRYLVQIGPRLARDLAYWIATDWDAARLFYEEDENFILLETIFREIKLKALLALRSRIKDEDSYYRIAFKYQNESALNWVHDYLDRGLCESDQACLLGRYCFLNKNHYENFSREIWDYKPFSDFVARYRADGSVQFDLRSSLQTAESVKDLKKVCSPFCKSESEAVTGKC